jgi:chromosome segregation ATPase
METATKSSSTQSPRSTDRVLEALSTLAALLERTIGEVRELEPRLQQRVQQAIQDTEASVQSQAAQHLETAVTETRSRLEEQFTRKTGELSAQWEEERGRLNEELVKVTQTKTQWEAERSRLNAELERLARVQAATQAEAEKAVLAMRAASAAAKTARAGASINSESLNAEIQRVEGLIREISVLIDDPTTELSTVIRKNVERAELESYLKGIRFALTSGGAS